MKRNLKLFLFTALLALAFAVVLGISASAATVTVSDGTEASLTSAISAASAGDTISITNSITLTAPLSIDKSLTITGPEGVTLQSATSGTYTTDRVFSLTTDGVELTLAGSMTFRAADAVVYATATCTVNATENVTLLSTGWSGAKSSITQGTGVALFYHAGTAKIFTVNATDNAALRAGDGTGAIIVTFLTVYESSTVLNYTMTGAASAKTEDLGISANGPSNITLSGTSYLEQYGNKSMYMNVLQGTAIVTLNDSAYIKGKVSDTTNRSVVMLYGPHSVVTLNDTSAITTNKGYAVQFYAPAADAKIVKASGATLGNRTVAGWMNIAASTTDGVTTYTTSYRTFTNTPVEVSTYDELKTAVSSATSGTVIKLTADITATATIEIKTNIKFTSDLKPDSDTGYTLSITTANTALFTMSSSNVYLELGGYANFTATWRVVNMTTSSGAAVVAVTGNAIANSTGNSTIYFYNGPRAGRVILKDSAQINCGAYDAIVSYATTSAPIVGGHGMLYVTMTGGSITARRSAIDAQYGGVGIDISGGTINVAGAAGSYANINIKTNSYVEMNISGTAVINHGYTDDNTKGPAINVVDGSNPASVINISGGTVQCSAATNAMIIATPITLNVSGGTISQTGANYALSIPANATVNVSGGLITTSSSSATIYNTGVVTFNLTGGTVASTHTSGLTLALNGKGTEVTVSGDAVVRGRKLFYFYKAGTVTINGGTIATVDASSATHLDAAGNTITGNDISAGDVFWINSGVPDADETVININDGIIYATRYVVYAQNKTRLNMTGGRVTTGTAGGAVFWNEYANTNQDPKACTIDISGGTVVCTSYGFNMLADETTITFRGNCSFTSTADRVVYMSTTTSNGCNGGNVTVNIQDNAVVTGAKYTLQQSNPAYTMTVNMTGGTLNCTGYTPIYMDGLTNTVNISGGTVTAGSTNPAIDLHSGTGSVTVSGGTVTISGNAPAIKLVGGTPTVSITGGTVSTTGSVAAILNACAGGSITVNGASALVTASGAPAVEFTSAGTLTVQNGEVKSTGNFAAVKAGVAGCTVRVTGGTVTATQQIGNVGAVEFTAAGANTFYMSAGLVQSAGMSAVHFDSSSGTNDVDIAGGTLTATYAGTNAWRGVLDCNGSTDFDMTGGTIIDANNVQQNGVLFRYGSHTCDLSGGTISAGYTGIHVWYHATKIDLTISDDAEILTTRTSGGSSYGIMITCKGNLANSEIYSTVNMSGGLIDSSSNPGGIGLCIGWNGSGSGTNPADEVRVNITGGEIRAGSNYAAIHVDKQSGLSTLDIAGATLSGYNGIFLRHPATVTIGAGTTINATNNAINVEHSADGSFIYKDNPSDDIVFDGTSITITGGTFTTGSAAVYFAANANTAHSVTISGATMNSNAAVQTDAASIDIAVDGGDYEDCGTILLLSANVTDDMSIGAESVALTLPSNNRLFVLAAIGNNEPTVILDDEEITPFSLDYLNYYDTEAHAAAGVVAYIGTWEAVGTKYYGGLAAAIAGATSGDTITIRLDETLTGPIDIGGITLTITSLVPVTISTPGITGVDANTMFNITGATTLTLGGQVTYNAGYRTIYKGDSTSTAFTLTLKDDVLLRAYTNTSIYVNKASTATVTVQDNATVVTSDPEYATAAYYGIYFNTTVTTGNFTMTGGALLCKNSGFLNKAAGGTTNISGGQISAYNGTPLYFNGGNCTVNISGGVMSSGIDGNKGTGGNGIWLKSGIITFNFTGGTLLSSSTGIGVCTASTVNISGGVLDCGGWGPVATGYDSSEGATVNITGGTLIGLGTFVIYDQHGANTINIYDGNIAGRVRLNGTGTVMNIYGGTFTRAAGSTDLATATIGTINVYGGSFTLEGDTGTVFTTGTSGTINLFGGYRIAGGATYWSGETYPDASRVYTGDVAKMVPGAAVRIVPDMNGIRFVSHFDKATLDYIDEINDDDTDITFHTIILPASHLNTVAPNPDAIIANLTVTTQYVIIDADEGIVSDGADGYYVRAALIRIKNYSRDFAAIAYAEYTVNGKTVRQVAAYDETDNKRSIHDVALACLEDCTIAGGYFFYTDAQLEVLADFAGDDTPDAVTEYLEDKGLIAVRFAAPVNSKKYLI